MATTPNSTTKIKFDLPRLHWGQTELYQSGARYKVVRCGRQWGKTNYGAVTCLEVALAGGATWWTAPTYDNAKPGYRLITNLCLQVMKHLPGVDWRKTDREFHFPGGGFLAMHTLSEPDNLRGDQLDYLVVDEAAFVPTVYAWERALEPMLLIRGGRALFISSPNGRNWFYELYQYGDSESQVYDPEWQSFHFTSYQNPYVRAEDLDKIKKRKPERAFSEEYMGEFIDDSNAVFKNIRAITIGMPEEPQAGRAYLIGVDLAKQNDYTIFSVFDVERKQQVHLARLNGVNYTEQVAALAVLAHHYNDATVVIEENGMEAVIELLEKTGVRFTRFHTSNASKEAIIRQMQVAFEQALVTLLHPDTGVEAEAQNNELWGYEMKRMSSGLFRYSAPYGQHDDTVMACAFAIDGMTDRSGQPLTVDTFNWFKR